MSPYIYPAERVKFWFLVSTLERDNNPPFPPGGAFSLSLVLCLSPTLGYPAPYVGRDLDYWGLGKWREEMDR